MPPDNCIAFNAKSRTKSDKCCLMYTFPVNADGSDKFPQVIIGKAHKPVCLKGKTGKQPGFYYHNNTKAWMQTNLVINRINSWNQHLKVEYCTILLLVNKSSGHSVYPIRPLTNTCLNFCSPNLTSHVQPLDSVIIANFKCGYCSEFINFSISQH